MSAKFIWDIVDAVYLPQNVDKLIGLPEYATTTNTSLTHEYFRWQIFTDVLYQLINSVADEFNTKRCIAPCGNRKKYSPIHNSDDVFVRRYVFFGKKFISNMSRLVIDTKYGLDNLFSNLPSWVYTRTTLLKMIRSNWISYLPQLMSCDATDPLNTQEQHAIKQLGFYYLVALYKINRESESIIYRKNSNLHIKSMRNILGPIAVDSFFFVPLVSKPLFPILPAEIEDLIVSFIPDDKHASHIWSLVDKIYVPENITNIVIGYNSMDSCLQNEFHMFFKDQLFQRILQHIRNMTINEYNIRKCISMSQYGRFPLDTPNKMIFITSSAYSARSKTDNKHVQKYLYFNQHRFINENEMVNLVHNANSLSKIARNSNIRDGYNVTSCATLESMCVSNWKSLVPSIISENDDVLTNYELYLIRQIPIYYIYALKKIITDVIDCGNLRNGLFKYYKKLCKKNITILQRLGVPKARS